MIPQAASQFKVVSLSSKGNANYNIQHCTRASHGILCDGTVSSINSHHFCAVHTKRGMATGAKTTPKPRVTTS